MHKYYIYTAKAAFSVTVSNIAPPLTQHFFHATRQAGETAEVAAL